MAELELTQIQRDIYFSILELPAHNGLVAGSSPAAPTNHINKLTAAVEDSRTLARTYKDPEYPGIFAISARRSETVRHSMANGLVYFIQNGCALGYVKIGRAVDPVRRLAEMRICNPYPLTLLAAMPGGMKVEKEVQARFATDRVVGEWFKPSEALLAFARAALTPEDRG